MIGMRGFEFGFRVRGGFVPPLQGGRELVGDVHLGLRSELHPRLSHDGLSALAWALRADTGGVRWEMQKAEGRMWNAPLNCWMRSAGAARGQNRSPQSATEFLGRLLAAPVGALVFGCSPSTIRPPRLG